MDIYRAHVLCCGGTGCTANGSASIVQRFEEKIKEAGLEKEVKVIRTGCFGLCEAGPVVIVYPEAAFYANMAIEHVAEVVSEHLKNGNIVTKASMDITDQMEVEVIDLFNKFVSMGGLKLEKAMEDFGLDFQGKSVLDIGSSTGGFTDCALQNGAAHVVAVDVGTQQLADSLRQDSRVTSIENKDFRELTPDEIGNETFDFIVSDVSFISLTYILPYCRQFLKPDGQMMLLIKPQFEAGPAFLNKSGIVVDEKGYKIAIHRVELEALNCGLH